MDRAESTVSGGRRPPSARADRADSSPIFRAAAGREAVMISFALARVMPTYRTRISSERISRLSRPDTASRAAVG